LDDFDDALILRVVGILLGVVFVLIILLASAHIICISFVHFAFLKVVTRNSIKGLTHIIDRTEKGKKKRSAKDLRKTTTT
jgi:hypothetical protein